VAPSNPPDSAARLISEMLKAEFDRLKPKTIEEANTIAHSLQDRYNRMPQNELGGLSPEQVTVLLSHGLLDSPGTLDESLTVEDLAGVRMFHNAACLLTTLRELGPTKATATGAFNRMIAARMFERFQIDESDRRYVTTYKRIINQGDVPHLELLRHLTVVAGLVLFRHRELKITRRGETLLQPARAGELFALLFRRMFQRLNLAAFDGMPDAPIVQHHIAFALYQIGRRANDWVNVDDVAPHLFLPSALPLLTPRFDGDPVPSYAYLRYVRWLREFGLVEVENESSFREPRRFRKTALFDRFIAFDLPPAVG